MEVEPKLRLFSPPPCMAKTFSEKISFEKQNKLSCSNLVSSVDQEIVVTGQTCEKCISSNEPFYHVKIKSVDTLKESTKQLLCLLEEIQSTTYGRNIADGTALTNYTKSLEQVISNETLNTDVLTTLETTAKNLDAIKVEDDHENCSVYKRLTRKCHCLNRSDYNDFVIHFNEDSKYTTSIQGEIIKNMRILRKFVYMGGDYTRKALMFLNEGLMESPHRERVQMCQACANADICNIFDDQSIVVFCISWPCKNKHYGDYVTQALAAGFLYKLAQIEDGRRYLNYSSKISNDIKKVLRKKSILIEVDTVESLNATLNLLKPVFSKNVAITQYFNISSYEGMCKKVICDLVHHREYMTLTEILMNLDILDSYSQHEIGQSELVLHLPTLLLLFKHLLTEFDNSEINIKLTSILNSTVPKYVVKEKESEKSNASNGEKLFEKATQVMNQMRNEQCQFPPKKASARKLNKSKISFGGATSKFRQPSKPQVTERDVRALNRSKKFNNERTKKTMIFVPIQK